MNRYASIRDQYCINEKCPYYGLKFDNRVSVHSKAEGRYRCAHCHKTWAFDRADIYFRLRSGRQKLDLAKALYDAGKSVREIAREVCVSKSTVQRWKAIFDHRDEVT